MEIGQIEAFERAVREGSFTRAAETLNLTQPAVSTRITALETELGGPLFERRGRRLELTPLGERFLPYARRILDVIADSLQEVRSFNAGRQGVVKIAAPTPFVLSFLVETLDQFRKQYPAVDILIRERNKTTIYEMLHDRTITLGLVNAPIFDRQMQRLARFQDPIRAVVGAQHPLATGDPLHTSDIYNHTIFRVSMFPEMTIFVDELVEHARAGSGGAVIAVPMVMALRLVILGQGVSFLPESYVRGAIESGELVYLDLVDMPHLVSQPVLITHKDRQLDTMHEKFVRVLKTRWHQMLVE